MSYELVKNLQIMKFCYEKDCTRKFTEVRQSHKRQ